MAINGTFTVDHDLYLDVCDITLGENAKINVTGGHILVINESHLYGCTSMWDGIYANASNTIVIDNSLIEDAKSAVNSIGGAQYILNNSVFNKNYKSLVVSQYSGSVTTATVKACVFTCRNFSSISTIGPIFSDYSSHGNASTYSTTTLKPAYPAYLPGTFRTFTGIEVSSFANASPLQIGETSGTGDLNIFDNLDYGIRVLNSNSVVVKNNLFENIKDLNPFAVCFLGHYCPHNQSGIYASGNAHYNCNLTIGGSGNYEPNNFIGCTYGISSTAFNNNILKNTFNTIYNAGIEIESGTNLTSLISENDLDNVKNGIYSSALGTNATLNITTNYINTNGGTGAIRTDNGIYIANTGRSGSNSTALVTIQHNVINYPTNGINIYLATDCYLTTNTIDFHSQLNSSSSNSGIRTNRSDIRANTNTISYTPAAPSNVGLLYGIYAEDTKGVLFDNQLYNNATGIFCLNSCYPIDLECNHFYSCSNGFRFGPSSGAYIGDQISTTNHLSSGNEWNNMVGSPFIAGTINNQGNNPWTYPSQPTPWYTCNWYYIIGATTNPSVYQIQGIYYMPTIQNPCIQAAWLTVNNSENREKALGNIVRGTNSYETFTSEYLLRDSIYAYQQLNANDSLLNLKTEEDEMYQQFYNYTANTNTGKFRQINNLVMNTTIDNSSEARAINDAITPRCTIENNQQTVNSIYLNKLSYEADTTNGKGAIYNYDSTETVSLQTIAYQNPITGGDAVYMARVMLFIDMDDDDGASRMHTTHNNNNNQQVEKKPKFNLYPNPNNGNMTLEYLIEGKESGLITIYDVSGRLVKQQTLNPENNLVIIIAQELSAGAYYYTITIADSKIKSDKLIIIK